MAETLAVKYRPSVFSEIVEQDIIKQILGNQLKTGSTKNAYLFVGPAGCGKTTAARILAKEINGGQGNPIEIDAASNNGVENIRTIIDQSKYRSLDSEYKVYIIDEVHMLTIGAWNAMLKLLEEPPSRTIFIMATTDPQKIPLTIMSRVQRFDFQKISLLGIESRLKHILSTEYGNGLKITDNGVNYIAKQANGGMRDGISLMEKCLLYYPEKEKQITIEDIIFCLGTVNYETMFKLFRVLLYKAIEVRELMSILNEVFMAGKDLKLFIKNFFNLVIDFVTYYHTEDITMTMLPDTEVWVRRLKDLVSEQGIMEDCLVIIEQLISLQNEIKYMGFPLAVIEGHLLIIRNKVAK